MIGLSAKQRPIYVFSKEEALAIIDYAWKQINQFAKDYVNRQHPVSLTG